jgi:hypothetical protein
MNSDPHHLQRRATLRRGALIGVAYGQGGTSTATRRFLRRGCLGVPSASGCPLARARHHCPDGLTSPAGLTLGLGRVPFRGRGQEDAHGPADGQHRCQPSDLVERHPEIGPARPDGNPDLHLAPAPSPTQSPTPSLAPRCGGWPRARRAASQCWPPTSPIARSHAGDERFGPLFW